MDNKRKCPIQIIEDKMSKTNRWITLEEDIHINKNAETKSYFKGYYDNLVGFHRDTTHHFDVIYALMTYKNRSNIVDNDIIRNPTIEEIMELESIIRTNGYKLNLKTYNLIQTKNYGEHNKGDTTV